MSLDKSGEIYVLGYRPVPNVDHDAPSPCQEDISKKLKYDWKITLDNLGFVVIKDGFAFNTNRDDKTGSNYPHDIYKDREERKKYVPRPTLIVVVLNSGKKNYFKVQNKYDLDKFLDWLGTLS
jgi:hypothetical protein